MDTDPRHCLGARDLVRNVGLGLCLSCRHHFGQGAHMDAPAYRDEHRVWVCPQYAAVDPMPAGRSLVGGG